MSYRLKIKKKNFNSLRRSRSISLQKNNNKLILAIVAENSATFSKIALSFIFLEPTVSVYTSTNQHEVWKCFEDVFYRLLIILFPLWLRPGFFAAPFFCNLTPS